MTTQTEALSVEDTLKLALEALEICEQDGYIPIRLTRDSITAIKEALAQPEREIDPSTTFDEVAKGLQVSRMAIAALDALTIEQRRSINEPLLKAQLFLKAAARVFKEALAQPEQEPVGFTIQAEIDYAKNNQKEYAGFWANKDDDDEDWIALYTTPPQRTWVGLTDDDLRQIILVAIGVAEAKLKEKNT